MFVKYLCTARPQNLPMYKITVGLEFMSKVL